MDALQKSKLLRNVGVYLGISLFLLIPFNGYFMGWIMFVLDCIILVGVVAFFWRKADKIVLNLIYESENPRKEFWDRYLKNQLYNFHIKRIPPLKTTIDNFLDQYYFYYKNSSRNICFAINNLQFRYRNSGGIDKTHPFSMIKDIQLVPGIMENDNRRSAFLKMEVRLINGKYDFCNITNVDFPIDEIEQILIHFNIYKVSNKKITAGNII